MNSSRSGQLSLGVSLDDDARFENFLLCDGNRQALENLKKENPEQIIFLWGPSGSGLTHLLQAHCHDWSQAGKSVIYIPLADRAQFSPEILQGANTLALVCIDDLDEVAGDPEWELAIFNAFNAIKESGTHLVMASRRSPLNLSMQLPDLQSRLQSALVYQVQELSDEEKLAALRFRAARRGLDLPEPVAEYICQRAQRSLTSLMELLERLDTTSLEQQRKLTIPLVKSTMGW